MPPLKQFIESQEEIDKEYKRRLKQQKKGKHGAKNTGGQLCGVAYQTCQALAWPAITCGPQQNILPFCNAAADMTCEVASEDGSMVKASVAVKDPESLTGLSTTSSIGKKHYVPAVELFRGHWKGILVQTCYEACELPLGGLLWARGRAWGLSV